MIDETTRQARAQLNFLEQEGVLHQQLPVLELELARLGRHRFSAAQWEAALPYLLYLCDAVALCQHHLREQMRSDEHGGRGFG